jgi:hypothetical protein
VIKSGTSLNQQNALGVLSSCEIAHALFILQRCADLLQRHKLQFLGRTIFNAHACRTLWNVRKLVENLANLLAQILIFLKPHVFRTI